MVLGAVYLQFGATVVNRQHKEGRHLTTITANEPEAAINFLFTWKHQHGSTVEFSKDGWQTDDAEKSKWLTQISDLRSSSPTFSAAIRAWLKGIAS
jgi:hypothetical protein